MAQTFIFLFLNLEKDHNSSDAHNCLGNDQELLLESLQLSLSIPTSPKRRTKRDEAQITNEDDGLPSSWLPRRTPGTISKGRNISMLIYLESSIASPERIRVWPDGDVSGIPVGLQYTGVEQ